MENVFLLHLKSSFRSWDIRNCVFPSSPLFLPVIHCFKGCSKINVKVTDVINCLNKNFITHFAWYLEKEKRYDIKTFRVRQLAYVAYVRTYTYLYWRTMILDMCWLTRTLIFLLLFLKVFKNFFEIYS